MAWTYGADPANSDRDAVRLAIGDTDTTDQQLQDSEIEYYLGLFGTTGSGRVLPAAARACDGLAAKYARQVDTTNQGLSVGAADRYKHYQSLAESLRREGLTVAEVFSGGNTWADKDALDEDSNLVQPSFRTRQFDWVRNDPEYDRFRY